MIIYQLVTNRNYSFFIPIYSDLFRFIFLINIITAFM